MTVGASLASPSSKLLISWIMRDGSGERGTPTRGAASMTHFGMRTSQVGACSARSAGIVVGSCLAR